MQRFTRRQFLEVGALSLGAAAVGTSRWPSVARTEGRGGGPVTRNALHLPPGVAAQSTLTAQAGRVDIGGGALTNGLFFNGVLPGPTFDVTRGTAVAATLQNRLADETSIHWHGLVVPTAADGQPQEAIAAGPITSTRSPSTSGPP